MAKPPPCNGNCGDPPPPPPGQCPAGVGGWCAGGRPPGIGECRSFTGYQANSNGYCCKGWTVTTCCK